VTEARVDAMGAKLEQCCAKFADFDEHETAPDTPRLAAATPKPTKVRFSDASTTAPSTRMQFTVVCVAARLGPRLCRRGAR